MLLSGEKKINQYAASLSNTIHRAYHELVTIVNETPEITFQKKCIEGTGGMISIADIIAYQIGWGILLVGWYKAGISQKTVVMPGAGFTTWDYVGLAQYFYKTYHYSDKSHALTAFETIVKEIIALVEAEYTTGNLEKEGVWEWCTLKSGKQWPLSKWIQVNTVAPYKRARTMIRKFCE